MSEHLALYISVPNHHTIQIQVKENLKPLSWSVFFLAGESGQRRRRPTQEENEWITG